MLFQKKHRGILGEQIQKVKHNHLFADLHSLCGHNRGIRLLFGFNLFSSVHGHFFNVKSLSVVAVSEQLALKFSGTLRLKHVQSSLAIRLWIPATTRNF